MFDDTRNRKFARVRALRGGLIVYTYCWMLSYLNNFINARRQTRESCWGGGKAEKRLLQMVGRRSKEGGLQTKEDLI